MLPPATTFPPALPCRPPGAAQLLGGPPPKPGRFILEDDYDSEFRFATRPLPSLQGMSGANGPVVYLTTFSKSLAPGMRIACMVLPQGLLERYQSDFSMYANTVSRYEQQTLCEFMANGYFARHIARMRLTYKRRMEAFAAALHAGLDPDLTLAGAHSGLHFLLTLPGAGGEPGHGAGRGQTRGAAERLERILYAGCRSLPPRYCGGGLFRPAGGGHSRRGGRVGPGVAANVTLHHLIGTIQCRPVRGRRPLQNNLFAHHKFCTGNTAKLRRGQVTPPTWQFAALFPCPHPQHLLHRLLPVFRQGKLPFGAAGEAGQGGFHYQRGDGAEIVEYTFQRVPVLRLQIR